MRRRDDPDLFFRADTGIWYTSFYDAFGKRVRQSTHQSDRALALQAARIIRREHLARSGATTTLETVLTEYIAAADRRGCADDTIDFYLRKSHGLLRVLGGN